MEKPRCKHRWRDRCLTAQHRALLYLLYASSPRRAPPPLPPFPRRVAQPRPGLPLTPHHTDLSAAETAQEARPGHPHPSPITSVSFSFPWHPLPISTGATPLLCSPPSSTHHPLPAANPSTTSSSATGAALCGKASGSGLLPNSPVPMASSSDPLFLLLLCLQVFVFFLMLQPLAAATSSSSRTTTTRAGKQTAPLILPLKTQQIAAGSLPRPPNKLYFHHNVSLTVPLTVGSPPQNVSMVLDTGSELSWLRCAAAAASQSGSPSAALPSFRPNSSASYAPIPCSSATCLVRTRDLPSPAFCNPANKLCRVSLSYADGSSADGDLASDIFRVGQSPPLRTLFGCVDSSFSSSSEDAVTAGLLGMNRGSLSFVSQMGARRFSYCISDRDATGVLLLGGDASTLPFPVPLNYTPLIQISLPLPYFDRVAYSVQLEGIRVGYNVLPIPKSVLVPDHTGAGQTMVDSGSQFTFLLGPAYTVLKNEFLRQTKGALAELGEPEFTFQGAFDTCFRVPRVKAASPAVALPAVVLMFRGGAEVAVSGERLLYQAPGEVRRGGADAVWCLTFGNSDLVPLEAYVIGHHHQQNVWVEYDLERSRVGFAPVRCDLASQRLGALD